MSKSFKSISRVEYEKSGIVVNDDIKVGCLQRIADACELMAKDRQRMINDLDFYKRLYSEANARACKYQRTISSLRGYITKLKNKGAAK